MVSALSTCIFPDPVAALPEMVWVYRHDGQILLREHGRSMIKPLAAHQDKTAAAYYESQAGCRWNQDPVQLIDELGWQLVNVNGATVGVYYRIQARPSERN